MKTSHLIFLVSIVVSAPGATLTVGPKSQFPQLCGTNANTSNAALTFAQPGDTITVDAAGNYSDQPCRIDVGGITIMGVNGTPHFTVSTASGLALGQGAWSINGDNVTVQNIEISGANFWSMASSGIRGNGVNLTLRQVHLHDNADGLLTANIPTGTILLDQCEFHHNGAGDGHSHNIYIGQGADHFIMQYSYSHDSKIGHLVKSRAKVNDILYNYLDDAQGSASYDIDIPSGGTTHVVGNSVHKSALAANTIMLAYREEANNRKHAPWPNDDLYVAFNTFVSDQNTFWHYDGHGNLIHGKSEPGPTKFIFIDPSVKTPAQISDNIFFNTKGATLYFTNQTGAYFQGNWAKLDGSTPGFVDVTKANYHLTRQSSAIGIAIPVLDLLLKAASQYDHGLITSRTTWKDAGAFQY